MEFGLKKFREIDLESLFYWYSPVSQRRLRGDWCAPTPSMLDGADMFLTAISINKSNCRRSGRLKNCARSQSMKMSAATTVGPRCLTSIIWTNSKALKLPLILIVLPAPPERAANAELKERERMTMREWMRLLFPMNLCFVLLCFSMNEIIVIFSGSFMAMKLVTASGHWPFDLFPFDQRDCASGMVDPNDSAQKGLKWKYSKMHSLTL